jgi:hypothetical protein
MSKGAKAVVQVVAHDPEKLQTFRTRSCPESKTLERYPIRSEWIALQRGPPRQSALVPAATRSATAFGNDAGKRCRRYCLTPCFALGTRRDGGVSRVAKGADCKSPGFGFPFNGNSENLSKFGLFPINRLGRVSE